MVLFDLSLPRLALGVDSCSTVHWSTNLCSYRYFVPSNRLATKPLHQNSCHTLSFLLISDNTATTPYRSNKTIFQRGVSSCWSPKCWAFATRRSFNQAFDSADLVPRYTGTYRGNWWEAANYLSWTLIYSCLDEAEGFALPPQNDAELPCVAAWSIR